MSKSGKTSKAKKSAVRKVSKLESANLVGDHDAVAVAAYFKAEKRHFQSGHELEDWYEAEAELAVPEQ